MSKTSGKGRIIKNKIRAFPLVVALGAAATLAACSSAEQQPLAIDLPTKDQLAGVMPLDEFQYPPGQDLKVSYAEALVTQPCLDKKGFVAKVPFVNTSNLDMSVRDPFDRDRAATLGYHSRGAVSAPDSAWVEYAYRTLKPGEQEALDSCYEELAEDRPEVPAQTSNFASSLAAAAFESSLRKPEVKAAESEWQECMKESGIPDLPSLPVEMPSKSVAVKFGLDKPGSVSASVVTQEERDLAVFDVGCRESSGFAEAQYDAEWTAQVEAVRDNGDALIAARNELTDLDRRITDIISENAPRS